MRFDEVARQIKAKYITGLSATLVRKDGHHPIITMRCGPVLYHVNAKQQAIHRSFEHYVFIRPTSFQPVEYHDDLRVQFQHLYEHCISIGDADCMEQSKRNLLECSLQ